MKDKMPSGSVEEIRLFLQAHEEEVRSAPEEILQALAADPRKSVQALGLRIQKEREKRNREIQRVKALYTFDEAFGKRVAGVDEVGRGPLAGPIVAAAVMLPSGSELEDLILGINDSKKLSKKMREELDEIIREKALTYAIYEMSNLDIDRLGIGYCNQEVFRGALRSLSVAPQLVLSDGYPVKDYPGENLSVIKGDTQSAAIACASIIAKVHRDRLMENLHQYYPQYGFDHNAGYGSPDHVAALKAHGPTPLHRMSFLRGILGDGDSSNE